MIDIWMLFTMTVPFLEVVLHTFTEVMKRLSTSPMETTDRPRLSTLVSNAGRLLLPIISLLFTSVFWTVGLIVSYWPNNKQDPNMVECLTIDTA